VCHFFTVAGCMSWAKFSHWSKTFDKITHNNRKAGVNLGLGTSLCWILSRQLANWLSTASSRAARTALGQANAQTKVTT